MHLLFRYLLPPGSALVLIAFLDTVACLMYIVIDYGGIIADNLQHGMATAFEEHCFLVLILLQLASTIGIFWYGVVFKGDKRMILAWMGVNGLFYLIYMIFILVMVITNWRYFDSLEVLKVIYLVLFTTVIMGYALHCAFRSLPLFATMGELEPLGKGWQFVIDYYKTHAKEAAGLVLMIEIIMNSEIFLERQITRFAFGHVFLGHENDTNGGVLTEETVLRYIRIGLCIIGFYLTYKEKKYWIFKWCMCYMATIAASIGIFIYLVFMWRAGHVLLTLIYFAILSINLLFRTGVLYTCIRYTDVFERRGIPM